MSTSIRSEVSQPEEGGITIAFRLPVEGWKRAVFHSDFGYGEARLDVDGASVLEASTRVELERGVSFEGEGRDPVTMRLVARANGALDVEVRVFDRLAVREDKLRARPSRSAWIHAWIAFSGSLAGFAASAFYLEKAYRLESEWALQMGNHTAGWHLLLTFTLFPASVWGQRIGIRAVQLVSFVFFCIHVGIALANADLSEPLIAFFNALSGALFLASAIYGSRAYRDMDPVAALLRRPSSSR